MTFAVLGALVERGVRFKIVGGVALNLLGLPRATQGLDIFVDPEGENVARPRQALHDVFDDASIDEMPSIMRPSKPSFERSKDSKCQSPRLGCCSA